MKSSSATGTCCRYRKKQRCSQNVAPLAEGISVSARHLRIRWFRALSHAVQKKLFRVFYHCWTIFVELSTTKSDATWMIRVKRLLRCAVRKRGHPQRIHVVRICNDKVIKTGVTSKATSAGLLFGGCLVALRPALVIRPSCARPMIRTLYKLRVGLCNERDSGNFFSINNGVRRQRGCYRVWTR